MSIVSKYLSEVWTYLRLDIISGDCLIQILCGERCISHFRNLNHISGTSYYHYLHGNKVYR